MAKKLHNRTVHFGYAHVFPLGSFSKQDFRKFEELLEQNNIEIMGNDRKDNACVIRCKTLGMNDIQEDLPFVIKLGQVGSMAGGVKEPVYTLSIIIDEKGHPNLMGKIFVLVNRILINNFEAPGFILAKEATIRMLVGTIEDKPSFQFLWEDLLNQKPEVLEGVRTGVPIRGGGLRIVNDVSFTLDVDNVEISNRDFKLESYLKDPRFLFTEGVYNWPTAKVYSDSESLERAIQTICDSIFENMNTTIDALTNRGD